MDRDHYYDSRQHSAPSTPASQYSSNRSRSSRTPDSQSPLSSTSGISESPHTPQRPFYRSPAPGPSDNLVHHRALREPFPQSPLYSRGPHDNLDGTALPYDRPRGASQSAQSSSSDLQSHSDSNQLIPPFQLAPAAQIREKSPRNPRTDGSRALSTSSSLLPAPSGPSEGLRGRTSSSGAASQYIAPAFASQQMPSSVVTQESHGRKTSLLGDVVLMAAISAANTEYREFPWYCVWTRALEKYTFPSSIGDSLICNITPQHVLIRSFDPSPPDSSSGHVRSAGSSRGSVAPSLLSEPRTPPRRSQEKVKRSHVIPDFAVILRRIKLPLSMPPVIEREKVILFAEIKPKSPRSKDPFMTAAAQISRQAYYAFTADSTLTTIGAILAFGNIWRYVEFSRPPMDLASSWSEFQDPTFGRPSPSGALLPRVPTYLRTLSENEEMSFDLMDRRGLSEKALNFLAKRILEREKDL